MTAFVARLIAGACIAALPIIFLGCGGGAGGRHVVRAGCISDPPARIADGFREPKLLVSKDGVLETTLKATYSAVDINGTKYKTMNYNGAFPGPTLIFCPGDRVVVHLENDLGAAPAAWKQIPPYPMHMDPGKAQLTNLHTHGLHVSPNGHSDNIFLSLAPGRTLTYEYHIPKSHLPGLNWYHPHRHGYVENQIYAGLFGVIDIQGGLDTLPEIRDFPIRTLTLASLELGSKNAKEPVVVPTPKSLTGDSPYFINGELNPEIDINPGEVQRWQILNTNDNAIVRLGLDDHVFYVLSNDGISLAKISPQHSLLLGPGERREVLVQGGPGGTYRLRSLAFRQFQGKGNLVPETTIATLNSSGSQVDDTLPKEALTKPVDLRGEKIDQRHRLVFQERKNKEQGGFDFLINGKAFDPNRVDQVMTLGEVNEWTLVNKTEEWHTFHIHVNDFQVVSVNAPHVSNVSSGPPGIEDVAPSQVDPADTVAMPPHSTITLLTRPTDFTGKFVFHCHMTFHEDHGMMGVVKVVPG